MTDPSRLPSIHRTGTAGRLASRRSLRAAILTGIWLLATGSAFAQQAQVQLNVTSRPNPYLSEWSSRRETAILTVTVPPTGSGFPAKLSATVTRDGVLQARTKTPDMAVITIPPGVSTWYADQIIPPRAVEFFGDAEKTAARTGMLPAGEYEICVDLLDPSTGRSLLAQPVCRMFSLTSYQTPVLLAPDDQSRLDAAARPIFRWTPVSPPFPSPVRYRVMVFEVLEGQRVAQAFRVNRPILDREVTGMTQLIWPADVQFPGAVSQYVWTVRALDDKRNPIGENDGYASPFSFVLEGGMARRSGGGEGAERRSGGQESGERRMAEPAPARTAETATLGPVRSVGQVRDILAPGGNTQPVDTTNHGSGNPSPGASGCQPSNVIPPSVSSTPGSKAAAAFVNDTVKIGFFDMKVLSATGTAASLNGKGSITVPWLRTPIAVEFTGLKVNANDEAYDGAAISELTATPDPYQTQWAVNMFGGLPWTTSRIKNLDTWLKNNFGKLVKDLDLQTQLANATNTPVKLPLGLNDLKGYTVAIAEMKFAADGAQLVAVMSLPILEHNSDLGFKASELFFTPSGPSFSSGTFGLLENVTFAPNANTYSVTFKAPTDSVNGTFIDWDCDGFRQAQVDIDFAFPRTWLLPSPDNGQKVAANIKTWISDWDDWIVNASLPKSTIVGTNGTELEVTNMAYDHSDIRNPSGISFPKGYQGDSTLAFQGFYIKQAKLLLPDKLRSFNDPSQRLTIFVNNLIVNSAGVTCAVEARNILNFPAMNVSSLGASMDTLRLSMVNSSVTTAMLKGRIVLPISDTTVSNALEYTALFQNGNGFQFTLKPKGPFVSPFLAKGRFALKPSSSITAALGPTNSFACTLNGDFEWVNVAVGPIKEVNITTSFEGMKIGYVEGGSMTYSIGTWSFASPQKSLAKIPITIDNVKFEQQPKQGNEVVRGTLKLEVIVNLVEKISGRTKLEVTGAVERPSGMRFRPKFISARVDSIGLYVKTAAVTINGFVQFYQEHPMYGNGFVGAIKATFTTAQMELSASARFGTTSYNSPTPFRYWYVDAKVILPPPGIVFLPGYAFYGFGVGAWQRMNVTTIPKPDINQVAGAGGKTSTPSSGATFTPDKNIGFGFTLTAVLGTAPDPKKFNADVTLGGQFSTSGGLVSISIKGELYAMAKLTERANAPVKGVIDIAYNHPQRIFHMQAKVDINKDPISTPGGVNMVVHLEGKTGNWYVKIGEPANRNIIKVAGINTESYFMFGKNITPPTGFSQATTNGLNSVGVFNLSPSSAATTSAIAGNGFAAGVGVNFDTGDRDRKLIDRVYLRYRVAGGFEVNLSLLRYPDNAICAGGGSLTGVNKWYAQGSVAAYALFYVKIHVTPKGAPCAWCCKGNNPNGCDYTLASVKLGAYLNGGFPKPTWLQGQAGGSYNLFGGLVKGSFTMNIDYGSACAPSLPAESGPTAQAEDAALMQQDALVQSVYPPNNTNHFPVTDRPRLLYGFTPNETFDVIESQGGQTGATSNRTFQARYTVTLQKRVNGNFASPMQIKTVANPLGEYLVLRQSNIVNMGAPKNMILDNEKGNVTPPPMDLGPNLDSSSAYKVTVVGTLYEYKNGSWIIAKSRTNQNITEAAASIFTTVAPAMGPPKPVQAPKNMIKN